MIPSSSLSRKLRAWSLTALFSHWRLLQLHMQAIIIQCWCECLYALMKGRRNSRGKMSMYAHWYRANFKINTWLQGVLLCLITIREKLLKLLLVKSAIWCLQGSLTISSLGGAKVTHLRGRARVVPRWIVRCRRNIFHSTVDRNGGSELFLN